jgi:hypothetical protein
VFDEWSKLSAFYNKDGVLEYWNKYDETNLFFGIVIKWLRDRGIDSKLLYKKWKL